MQDVSDMLQLSEVAIHQLIDAENLPSYRLDNRTCFDRMEIEAWLLNQQRSGLMTKGTDLRYAATRTPLGAHRYSLSRALHQGGVIQSLPGKNKEAVIRNAAANISLNLDLDPEILSELLIDRELLMSTALGGGIALPHTRDFLLKKDVVAIAFLEEPVSYGAPDEKPVDTLIFLFASDNRCHLHLLAKIARFCQDENNLAMLKSRPSEEVLLRHIKAWEQH